MIGFSSIAIANQYENQSSLTACLKRKTMRFAMHEWVGHEAANFKLQAAV